jgi:hypothetical protein
MTDTAFIVLIVIAIVIFLVVLGLLIFNNTTRVIIGTSNGIANSNHCEGNISTLPNLSSDLCCVIFGQLTSNKYLSSLNLVVSLEPSPFLDVCAGFCSQGYDSINMTCLGDIASDTGQFNQCVSNTSNTIAKCSDASNPVATSNGQYMYANSVGTVLCPVFQACALQL